MIRAFVLLTIITLTCCTYHDLNSLEEEGETPDPSGNNNPFVCNADSVSWQKNIQPIMLTYCVRSTCHDGKTRADFSKYSIVKANASSIKIRVRNRSMPFDGPMLSRAQIDSVSCWVDSGARE